MFIRFVVGKIHADSRGDGGLFCALDEIGETIFMEPQDYEALCSICYWFAEHLDSPLAHLPTGYNYESAVCWFKSSAHEHIARAWEMVAILERSGLFTWTIKVKRTGPVFYEDDVQVFALHPW